ncbi:MAG: metal ABC transporter ATP-binding protein [Fluviicola sp.]|jgi:ABC-type Mn2+/Zn2+ transport system ATPase subunit
MKKTIEISNLNVNYGSVKALSDITVSLQIGELIGVVGPNGSGKSTFLKSLVDLLPHTGKVTFDNQIFTNIRSEIAFVPQRESVDWDFPISVFDVVSMGILSPKKWWKSIKKSEKESISKAIDLVGLSGFENRRIGQLSGGQQQRVFIARALVQNANYFLLDEPFVGIDIQTQTNLLEIFKNLKNEGKTIIMVHHDLSDAAKHFDSILLLNNEKVAFGKTSEILVPEILKKVYPNLFITN